MPIILRLLLAALACVCIFGARAITHQYNSQSIDRQQPIESSLQDASAGSSLTPAALAADRAG